MEQSIIELKGLTKNYGSVKAVDHLDLSVNKGEIFGLLGPNGAGKSTTILMMLGLTEPSAGQALICGLDPSRDPIPVKRKVGYLPDNMGFYNNLSALENLIYIGRLNGIAENEVADRCRDMLVEVGLEAAINKKAGAFSRGMKQRLGLADILIREPEVIVLDEPTIGIDPAGVHDFLGLIHQLSRQQGLTVLLSSHYLHQVQQVCDRVGIFVSGHLLAEGDIESLAGNLFGTDPYVVNVQVRNTIENPAQLESGIRQLPSVKKVDITHDTVSISSDSDITPDIVRFFVNGKWDVNGVQRKTYGLDEIYQRYFEDNLKENTTHEKSSGLFQRSFIRKFRRS